MNFSSLFGVVGFLILACDFPNEAIQKATLTLLVCHQSDKSFIVFLVVRNMYHTYCVFSLMCSIETILSFLLFSILCLQQSTDVEVGADLVPSVTVKVLYIVLDCNVQTISHISSHLSLVTL